MLKSSLLAVVLAVAATGNGIAQTSGDNALASYDVSRFETQPVAVAVATDKQSGRKFNVVKLASGKTMILMSAERVKALTPFADDSEMMYSGHPGTSR